MDFPYIHSMEYIELFTKFNVLQGRIFILELCPNAVSYDKSILQFFRLA